MVVCYGIWNKDDSLWTHPLAERKTCPTCEIARKWNSLDWIGLQAVAELPDTFIDSSTDSIVTEFSEPENFEEKVVKLLQDWFGLLSTKDAGDDELKQSFAKVLKVLVELRAKDGDIIAKKA